MCCDAYKSDEAELSVSPLNKTQMDKICYDINGFIKTEPCDSSVDDDLNVHLHLNGLWKNGSFLADTSTGLVKARRDIYLQYKKFIKKLDKAGQCTSGNVQKKINEIERMEHRIEYAGVLLFFLKKKHRSLVVRGL